MPDIIANLWWFMLGLLMVVVVLTILALTAIGVMMVVQFVKDWLDDMGWGA